jgi:hypothetical protein
MAFFMMMHATRINKSRAALHVPMQLSDLEIKETEADGSSAIIATREAYNIRRDVVLVVANELAGG